MQESMPTRAVQDVVPAVRLDRSGKYLVFRVGMEEFGTEVLKVREIMRLQDITPVPQTPPYVKGVINLRGKVIPVIELRLKFGMKVESYTARTCIIVLRVCQGGLETMMGIVVDGVSEVLTLMEAEIEDTPDFGTGLDLRYVNGLATIKGKVKILLNMDKVLDSSELSDVHRLHS